MNRLNPQLDAAKILIIAKLLLFHIAYPLLIVGKINFPERV